ncbi:MAG: RluA family pseudouridine synthase [Acidobacteriota bacterium]|nr:RluA family pseudouridine synthase [Acidobacteriota bacterium]
MRLDQAIAARNPEISRRKARELIAGRRVLVNERPVSIASRDVRDDDRITIIDTLRPQFEILKVTDAFVAVNKPAGMPTQPTRDRSQHSLEELLRVEFRSIFLVHRLDTGTSGVVIFARTREAAAELSQLFAGRSMRKIYLGRIEGTLDSETTIDRPIGGKDALTIVTPLGDGLVEAEIRTGRTHQIRVHLASIGHPIAGDRRYRGKNAPRLMLHAWKLEHATIGAIEAPPPDDLIPSGAPWKPK